MENADQRKPHQYKGRIDWVSLGVEVGIYVLQGAAMALGGLAVKSATDAIRGGRTDLPQTASSKFRSSEISNS